MTDQKRFLSWQDKKAFRPIFYFLCVILVIALIIIFLRIHAEKKLRKETNLQAIPVVATLTVKPGPAIEEIVLPGNVQAWHEATIYARTNGYIKKWYVDIGSRVKTGDLLAEIESPEVDAQLKQTQADLNTAIANASLAASTAKRWMQLVKTNSVSKQERDEKVSAAEATAAIVKATRANRDRLRELVSFERVTAPFDGVISSRTTDIGSLINAGSGRTVVPLFRIVQAHPLRIYVRIPQIYTESIKATMTVTLRFAEHPGKSYPAKLLETASAIDVPTRTLLAQFIANNDKDEILPGGYTEVHFKMPMSSQFVHIPVNTLLFRQEGLQVATLTETNEVALKSITVRRDFGNKVEVNTGLTPGERLILNPPDSLFNGEKVRLASQPEPKK